MHSDQDLRGSIEPILANVDALLASSELYAPDLRYDIFFGHDNAGFEFLDRARWSLTTPLSGLARSPVFSTGWPPHLNHIVCFEVPDIAEARAEFEEMGKRILGPTRIGAHGTPIFFLHPKDMMGQLTEIMETPKGDTHWSN